MGISLFLGFPLTLLFISTFLSYFIMNVLRVGSLNVNGIRASNKWSLLKESIKLKDINVMFLQETQ